MDRGEDVERAFRFETVQAHVAEPLDHQAAPFVILGDHAVAAGPSLLQRFHSGDLGGDGGAEHGELMDFGHRTDEVGVAQGVADSPAGHGIGLGEAVQQDGAVAHSRQRGETGVYAVIGQIGVDLVGYYDEIVFFSELGDSSQVFPGHDGSGGIIRIADQQGFGPGRQRRRQLIDRHAELVLAARADAHRLAAGQRDAGLVGNVAGFRHQHFVTGREDGAHGEIQRLADADGDERLAFRIVDHAVIGFNHFGDFLPQFQQAVIRGVGGVAALQAVHAAFPDMPGRDEIRLADAERNDAAHFGDDVEEAPDARRRDRADNRRYAFGPVHGVTNRRRSASSSSMMTPSSLYFFRTKWVVVLTTPSMVASLVETNWATSLRVGPSTVTAKS